MREAPSGSVGTGAGYRFDFCEQVAELAVVDLYAVVEVQLDAQIGVVAELLVEAAQLVQLAGQLVALLLQPLGLGAGAGGRMSSPSLSMRAAILLCRGTTYSMRMRASVPSL